MLLVSRHYLPYYGVSIAFQERLSLEIDSQRPAGIVRVCRHGSLHREFCSRSMACDKSFLDVHIDSLAHFMAYWRAVLVARMSQTSNVN